MSSTLEEGHPAPFIVGTGHGGTMPLGMVREPKTGSPRHEMGWKRQDGTRDSEASSARDQLASAPDLAAAAPAPGASDSGKQVFVLCTGRCGSSTFAHACRHVSNFTVGHESQIRSLGAARLLYPKNHIEVDNRLSWFLGRLDETYGDSAYYVHLTRDPHEVARSYKGRWRRGIVNAYAAGILCHNVSKDLNNEEDHMAVCLDMVDSVNANIRHFLKDKSHVMNFALETAKSDFERFWDWIGAEGDLAAALAEWDVRYNASCERPNQRSR